MKRLTLRIFLLLAIAATATACGGEAASSSLRITTSSISDVTRVSARASGEIKPGLDMVISARGVCWGTNETPTTRDFKVSDDGGAGTFTLELTKLTPATTYYARAYAIISGVIHYGETISFTTLGQGQTLPPEVRVVDVEEITEFTAKVYSTIADPGSSEVTVCGICWSTAPTPTMNDATLSGLETLREGDFTLDIEGLSPDTEYYLRPYAENSYGLSYGDQVSFRTKVLERYDEGVSDLAGDIAMPSMAAAVARCYRSTISSQSFYWGILLKESGVAGMPDRQLLLEINTPTGSTDAIPPGRYDVAPYPDRGASGTAEPGNFYNGVDWGCWYYAYDGAGNVTSRASAIGAEGCVEVAVSEDGTIYTVSAELYDTSGNKITARYDGAVTITGETTRSPLPANRER